jgi:hypothetical protein
MQTSRRWNKKSQRLISTPTYVGVYVNIYILLNGNISGKWARKDLEGTGKFLLIYCSGIRSEVSKTTETVSHVSFVSADNRNKNLTTTSLESYRYTNLLGIEVPQLQASSATATLTCSVQKCHNVKPRALPLH